MNRFKLEIVTPEGKLFDREVESVEVPGSEGRFGVLKDHMNLVASIKPGVVEVKENGSVSEKYVVFDGTAEVTAGNCALLVEKGVNAVDIQKEEVEEHLRQAKHDLAKADTETSKGILTKEVEYLEQQLAMV